METTNIIDFGSRDGITDALTEMLRKGAPQFRASAVEAELEGYMSQFGVKRTVAGPAAVARDGHHPERPIQTGQGL